jgi:hypothetical protein
MGQIDATKLFYGAPATITIDGTEVGATFDAPSVEISYETNADKARPQGGRMRIVKGLLFARSIGCKVKFTVNEITAEKAGWAMPGSTSSISGSTTTIQPVAGRFPSSAYKPVVLSGVGLDGLPLVVEIDNGINTISAMSMAFSDEDWSGFAVEIEATGNPDDTEEITFRVKVG